MRKIADIECDSSEPENITREVLAISCSLQVRPRGTARDYGSLRSLEEFSTLVWKGTWRESWQTFAC
jgi:hypothetical protein